jgi:hypothetical protein
VFGAGGRAEPQPGRLRPSEFNGIVPVQTGAHGGGTLVASCGGIYHVAGKSGEAAAAAAFGWMFVF